MIPKNGVRLTGKYEASLADVKVFERSPKAKF